MNRVSECQLNVQQAKQRVVDAGKRLIAAQLIVRTWGNVSARISEDEFVITPSGKAYETLTPEDIVTVNIADGRYTGPVKPSSEKGIHAAVYRRRPDINFVIHTHQVNASVLSTLRTDIHIDVDGAARAVADARDDRAADITAHVITDVIEPDGRALIGPRLRCAAFALPTTNKLANNVAALLDRSDGTERAFLLASHGAVCLGEDDEEAFAVAAALETVCEKIVLDRLRNLLGVSAGGPGRHPEGGGPDGALQGETVQVDPWHRVRVHFLHNRLPATEDTGSAYADGLAAHMNVAGDRTADDRGADNRTAGNHTDHNRADRKHTDHNRTVGAPLYNSERFSDHFKLYVGATADNPFPEDEAAYIEVPFAREASQGMTPRLPPRLSSRKAPRLPPEPSPQLRAAPSLQLPPELTSQAEIHRQIYERWNHIHAIVHSTAPDVLTVSRTGMNVPPLLDDFAQIVGTSAKSVRVEISAASAEGQAVASRASGLSPATAVAGARDIVRRLRGRYAVMLEQNGALCCAPSKADALAVAYVLAKNCKAVVGSELFGGAKPIPYIEALLMRLIYIASYSKKAGSEMGPHTG